MERQTHTIYVYIGPKPQTFQGKGGLVELEHFDKHFIKNTRKRRPAWKHLGDFSSGYSNFNCKLHFKCKT